VVEGRERREGGEKWGREKQGTVIVGSRGIDAPVHYYKYKTAVTTGRSLKWIPVLR